MEKNLTGQPKIYSFLASEKSPLIDLNLEPLWEILGMGKNLTQQPRIYSFLALEKSPLIDLNLSLSKNSFLPFQTAVFK